MKKPTSVFAGGLTYFFPISLAAYFRPWQSAGMDIP